MGTGFSVDFGKFEGREVVRRFQVGAFILVEALREVLVALVSQVAAHNVRLRRFGDFDLARFYLQGDGVGLEVFSVEVGGRSEEGCAQYLFH